MKREALDKEAEHLQKKLSNTAYQKAKPESWQADKELLETKQHEQQRLRFIVERRNEGGFKGFRCKFNK